MWASFPLKTNILTKFDLKINLNLEFFNLKPEF